MALLKSWKSGPDLQEKGKQENLVKGMHPGPNSRVSREKGTHSNKANCTGCHPRLCSTAQTEVTLAIGDFFVETPDTTSNKDYGNGDQLLQI